MTIVILGKSNCGKCKSAREKLEGMGLAHDYITIDNPKDWRRCAAHNALASAVMDKIDPTKELPVVVIDGKAFRYAAAMKELKRGKLNEKR